MQILPDPICSDLSPKTVPYTKKEGRLADPIPRDPMRRAVCSDHYLRTTRAAVLGSNKNECGRLARGVTLGLRWIGSANPTPFSADSESQG